MLAGLKNIEFFFIFIYIFAVLFCYFNLHFTDVFTAMCRPWVLKHDLLAVIHQPWLDHKQAKEFRSSPLFCVYIFLFFRQSSFPVISFYVQMFVIIL